MSNAFRRWGFDLKRNLIAISSVSTALIVLVLSLSFAAPVQAFCVTLSPSPTNVSLAPGQSATVTISVSTAVNFDYGTETFSATGLPQDVTTAFAPSTIDYTGGGGGGYGGGSGGYSGTSTLTLTASNMVAPGSYQVTLHLVGNGPDSGQGNVATITLVVSQPTPEFPAVPAAILVALLMTLSFAMISFKKRKHT
jgi:hypothetical protein